MELTEKQQGIVARIADAAPAKCDVLYRRLYVGQPDETEFNAALTHCRLKIEADHPSQIVRELCAAIAKHGIDKLLELPRQAAFARCCPGVVTLHEFRDVYRQLLADAQKPTPKKRTPKKRKAA